MFGFGLDKRTLYIIMIILIVSTFARYLSDPNVLLNLALTVPAILIAITFHEFAHAFVADKLGDDTPRREGRLSLNPLAHLDPVGTVLLLFAGFGWGKPVSVNPRNFNRKISESAGNALVSVAGPLMNFILAIIFTIIYCVIIKFTGMWVLTQMGKVVLTLVQSTIIINVGLGVFNLVPLPPLDGSKILMHFLPYNAKAWFEKYEQIFYIVFVVLWITGLAGYIISPVIDVIYTGIINLIGAMFGM